MMYLSKSLKKIILLYKVIAPGSLYKIILLILIFDKRTFKVNLSNLLQFLHI